VLTVTEMHGGKYDSVAESLKMSVVLVWYGRDVRSDMINRVKRTAANIASSAGATADADVVEDYVPSVHNDPNLTARMRPTLARVAGKNHLLELAPQTYSDDFAFYEEKIPGLFVLLGARAPGDEFFPNHSPKFHVDESGILVGVRTLAHLSLDYMLGAQVGRRSR